MEILEPQQQLVGRLRNPRVPVIISRYVSAANASHEAGHGMAVEREPVVPAVGIERTAFTDGGDLS